jgi:hypothetical protein
LLCAKRFGGRFAAYLHRHATDNPAREDFFDFPW